MFKRLPLLCLVIALISSSGCSFWKRSSKPQQSSGIAGEVEESFRRRWIERRVAELAAQGVAAAPAQSQAAQEFGEKYAFTGSQKK